MNKVKEIGEKKEVKIKVGSMWVDEGDYYILCSVISGVMLINLSNGSRWNDPQDVKDRFDINACEWGKILGERTFTRVHAIEIRTEDD